MNDVSIGFGWESAKRLSDRALLAEVGRVSRAQRVLVAELVAHIAEMDERKLYLREATPSMFVYCTKRLGFSEDEACRRIDAARLVRKWPWILREIASGALSLTVVGKLKPFLTPENAQELVKAVSGVSVREAEHVLAARYPKPDVPDSIRKVPERARATAKAPPPNGCDIVVEQQASPATQTETTPRASNAKCDAAMGLATDAGANTDMGTAADTAAGTDTDTGPGTDTGADPDRRATATIPCAPGRPIDRGSFQPLSAERIQVKFTASRELEEKIALARDLMSHKNPRGDLATLFESALDLWIEHALKQKLGKTERPQKRPRPAKRERVTNATRREVHERDGLACSFVSETAERCGARAFLELDHRKSKGTGGGSEPDNMRMLCRAHNQSEAERVYGKAHMERSRSRSRGKTRDDGVKERTTTHEFVVGLIYPRRNGYSSSAGRSEVGRVGLACFTP